MNILTRRENRSIKTISTLVDDRATVSASRKYARLARISTKWPSRLIRAKGEFFELNKQNVVCCLEAVSISIANSERARPSLSDKRSRIVTDTSDPSYFIGDSKTGHQPGQTDMSRPSITPGTLHAAHQRQHAIDHWYARPRPTIGSSHQTTRGIKTSTKLSKRRRAENIDAIRNQ